VSSEEEKNKALVRRFIEAQLEKDLSALEEMMAPDFVDRSLMPGQEPDREGFSTRWPRCLIPSLISASPSMPR
jgi:hypothetical protein